MLQAYLSIRVFAASIPTAHRHAHGVPLTPVAPVVRQRLVVALAGRTGHEAEAAGVTRVVALAGRRVAIGCRMCVALAEYLSPHPEPTKDPYPQP